MPLTSKQQREWQELCLRAVKEPDPAKQMEIVAELNRILQRPKKAQPAPLEHGLRQRRSQ